MTGLPARAKQHTVPEPKTSKSEPLRIEYRATADLVPYARNARTHSAAQVDQVAKSIVAFGWTNPVLVDAGNGIIAGHGRVLAALKLGITRVPVVELSHMTEAQRRAYMIADNQHALNAGWDEAILKVELQDLAHLIELDDLGGVTLESMGIDADQFADMVSGDEGEPEAKGSLLALVDLSIADPKTVTATGDVWALGRHWLAVCSVVKGWPLWRPLLEGGDMLFCPFPGPFVSCSEKASTHRLLMVQPNTYIASHIVDRYNEIHSDSPAVKRGAP